MSGLRTLLKQIAEDAALWKAVKQDPVAVAAEYSLSAEEMKLLRSGDVEKLRAAVGDPKLQLPRDLSALAKHDLRRRDGDVPFFN